MLRVLSTLLFLLALIFPVRFSWPQDWKGMLPAGEGKDLTVELCSSCHDLQKTVVARKGPQEWEQTVLGMISRGAKIFPDEADQIIKYLAKSFPPGKPPAQ